MKYLRDDIQIFLVLAVGGSLMALAACRLKYGRDWLDPWLMLTKFVTAFGVAIVALGEHAMIYAWWAAAPLLVSVSVLSVSAWLMTWWILRRKAQDAVLDLQFTNHAMGHDKSSRFLFYWGIVSLVLLLASLTVAILRIR